MLKSKTQWDWNMIVIMPLLHLGAAFGLTMVTKTGLVAFAILYGISVLGITVGFHRFFTHKSFKTYPIVAKTLAVMGTLALQGGLREWVAHHRMHHAGSDTIKDPHSASKGFLFSHVLWLFRWEPQFDERAIQDRYTRDILADPFYRLISADSVVVSLQILLGLFLWFFWGFETMMWGIFVRLIAVYHVTWAVNSVCHMWGYKNFKIADSSRNNPIIGIIAFGEGWHNNHHGVAESARHGLRWFELDISWIFIKSLQLCNLAWSIREARWEEPGKISDALGQPLKIQ